MIFLSSAFILEKTLGGTAMENKIKVFENKNVRTVWNEEEEDWNFSVIDIVAILSESENPRRYWSDLKRKLFLKEVKCTIKSYS